MAIRFQRYIRKQDIHSCRKGGFFNHVSDN